MRLFVLAVVLGLGCVSTDSSRDLETELRKVQERFEQELARNVRLDKELRESNYWLSKYRARYSDGRILLSGVVTAVRTRVSIRIGSDDGVRVGDLFQIRRDSDYVTQIEIVEVRRDRSVGEVDADLNGLGAPPRIGDIADGRGH